MLEKINTITHIMITASMKMRANEGIVIIRSCNEHL